MKENIYYWTISLNNPERIIDDFYFFDEIIVDNGETIESIQQLRELITCYCVIKKLDKDASAKIVDSILNIIVSVDRIQYTEFIAFWKVLDLSYSIFKKLDNKKQILTELLDKYCERRYKLYDKLGYSNTIVQALYDSGASRKKGDVGIDKVLNILKSVIQNPIRATKMNILLGSKIAYFLPDKNDKKLFENFLKSLNIRYKFGSVHQGKRPDIVVKINDKFIIIEAKHIKEKGGAQDKQVLELIEFIKYSEAAHNIHYVSFMDGLYFNNFIFEQTDNKVIRQKEMIEDLLSKNKNNFFVNTVGLKELLKDIYGINIPPHDKKTLPKV